mgnify:CR=1 FL=1
MFHLSSSCQPKMGKIGFLPRFMKSNMSIIQILWSDFLRVFKQFPYLSAVKFFNKLLVIPHRNQAFPLFFLFLPSLARCLFRPPKRFPFKFPICPHFRLTFLSENFMLSTIFSSINYERCYPKEIFFRKEYFLGFCCFYCPNDNVILRLSVSTATTLTFMCCPALYTTLPTFSKCLRGL